MYHGISIELALTGMCVNVADDQGKQKQQAASAARPPLMHVLAKLLRKTLPASAFFMVLFWTISGLFGIAHVIPALCYTALFNSRLHAYNSPAQYAHFFGMSILTLVAARIATLNIPLCIVTNIAMPFVFLYMRSSQFTPMRYYRYLMLFVFLQLKPQLLDNFWKELMVIGTCCIALTVVLIIAGRVLHTSDQCTARLHVLINQLADALEHLSNKTSSNAPQDEFLQLHADFVKLTDDARKNAGVNPRMRVVLDMYAMLAERTAYLVGQFKWDENKTSSYAADLHKLAKLTRKASCSTKSAQRSEAITHVEALLSEAHTIQDEDFRRFFCSYLHMILLVLREPNQHTNRIWRMSPRLRIRVASFYKHPSISSFELSFSVRCAIVLTVGFTISLAFPISHLYWFPINAFLLTQPYPAESMRRMRTRTLGTVLGCLFVHMLSTLSLPIWAVLTVCMILVMGRYASTQGKTPMAFFGSSYALSIVSLSTGERYAIFMRLVCLIAAVIFVFIVTRLIVPTSDRALFRANLDELFTLIESYWALLRASLHTNINAVTSSEAIWHMHTVHAQAASYVNALPQSTSEGKNYHDAAQHVLACQRKLTVGLEQLNYFIRLDGASKQEYPTLEQFMTIAEACSNPFVADKRLETAENLVGKLQEEELRALLNQYLTRAKSLATALDHLNETASACLKAR